VHVSFQMNSFRRHSTARDANPVVCSGVLDQQRNRTERNKDTCDAQALFLYVGTSS